MYERPNHVRSSGQDGARDGRQRRHRRGHRARAAQPGRDVALSGTRIEALDALAAELGERVHVLPCDLADTAAVEKLVPAAEAAMGALDILVNNAGLTRDNLFMRMKDEDWDSCWRSISPPLSGSRARRSRA